MKENTVALLLKQLQEGVNKITTSKEYCNYLKTMTHFPAYSIRNTILIYSQKPDATFVAGYHTWQKLFGRHVRKGEKGIRILAPYTYTVEQKDGHTLQKETKTGFRAIYVFDISQTEGPSLPALPQGELLCGEFALFRAAIPVLEQFIDCQIQQAKLDPDTLGMTRYDQRLIIISTALEERHAFKTLTHECAHLLLHNFDARTQDTFELLLMEHRDLREIEAESVSYIVCNALGLDSADYSFKYVASWKSKSQFLEKSLERIAKVSQSIISLLQQNLPESMLPQPSGPLQTSHDQLKPDPKAPAPKALAKTDSPLSFDQPPDHPPTPAVLPSASESLDTSEQNIPSKADSSSVSSSFADLKTGQLEKPGKTSQPDWIAKDPANPSNPTGQYPVRASACLPASKPDPKPNQQPALKRESAPEARPSPSVDKEPGTALQRISRDSKVKRKTSASPFRQAKLSVPESCEQLTLF